MSPEGDECAAGRSPDQRLDGRGQRRKVAVRPLSGDSWEPVLCSCPGALARAHGSYLLTLFCPTRHPVLTLDSHLLELLTQ